ncbi:MAG: hypothetical protein WDM94_05720 [Bauldia sp.]
MRAEAAKRQCWTPSCTLAYRFGIKGNEPFAAFTVVYVLLTLALFVAVP